MNYQTEEQKAVLDFFSKNTGGFGGKFIDVNSNDPIESPTRCLYERGFTGVCVIPNPYSYSKFKDVYGKDMRIHLINLAVMPNDSVAKFYISHDGEINTASINCKNEHEKSGTQFHEVNVNAIGVQRFMSQFGMDIEFLCLQCDGMAFELFNLLPDYFLHRLKAICINHDKRNADIMSKLKIYGFRQVLLNDKNLIAVK